MTNAGLGHHAVTTIVSEKRRRLLLTGASGMLGATLVERWSARWDIVALTGRHQLARGLERSMPVDLRRPQHLADLVVEARPDAVVHAAAWTDVDACEADPATARALHRDATDAIARGAARAHARLIYVSTDAVFSGTSGPHREQDPIDPLSVYARTKREGEEAALSACSSSLVVRTCIVGWNAQRKRGLVEWLLDELRAGRPVAGFADVAFTPITATRLVDSLEQLLELKATGVLHVAGGECVTKHAFATSVAHEFGLDRSLVRASRLGDVPLRAPRPLAPCLDCSRYVTLTNAAVPSVLETVRELRELEASGWRERMRTLLVP